MNVSPLPLRTSVFKKTRCLHGRRAITPIRHKKKKTRSNHLVGKHGVKLPICEHSGASHVGQRENEDKKEYSGNQEWKGDEDRGNRGEREDKDINKATESRGNPIDSNESVHPGSIQELREVSAEIIPEADTQDQEEKGLIEDK